MRIANGYPDPLLGCTLFPEDEAAAEELGFGFDVPAEPLSIEDIGSGLETPEPVLDPNDPADQLKVKPGL